MSVTILNSEQLTLDFILDTLKLNEEDCDEIFGIYLDDDISEQLIQSNYKILKLKVQEHDEKIYYFIHSDYNMYNKYFSPNEYNEGFIFDENYCFVANIDDLNIDTNSIFGNLKNYTHLQYIFEWYLVVKRTVAIDPNFLSFPLPICILKNSNLTYDDIKNFSQELKHKIIEDSLIVEHGIDMTNYCNLDFRKPACNYLKIKIKDTIFLLFSANSMGSFIVANDQGEYLFKLGKYYNDELFKQSSSCEIDILIYWHSVLYEIAIKKY